MNARAEENGMKCKRSTGLIVLILALALVPITYAKKPSTAEGQRLWSPDLFSMVERLADGNAFYNGPAYATWTGTFDGASTEDYVVVYHSSGFQWYMGEVMFVGTVDGITGTLVIKMQGRKVGEDWSGTWVIISGTGGLTNLHGQGTWSGPGFNPVPPFDPGVTSYVGRVHFK